eukprot:7224675-Pyramimonas_sp.AAC.1
MATPSWMRCFARPLQDAEVPSERDGDEDEFSDDSDDDEEEEEPADILGKESKDQFAAEPELKS